MVTRVLKLRSVIEKSRLARVACAALLVLFVLICGVHFMGDHRYTEGEGAGLADGVRQLVLLLGAALAAGAVLRSQRSETSFGSATPSGIHHVSHRLALVPIPLEAPLRR